MGAVIFTTLVLLGMTAVLARVPLLFAGLKLFGGLWLLLFAWRLWQGAAAPLTLAGGGMDHPNPAASFRTGLATQVTNPKTAIYYGSVFAALLPQHPPGWLVLALPRSCSSWRRAGTCWLLSYSRREARVPLTCAENAGWIGRRVPSWGCSG